jgi:hypothetical protein
LACWGGEFTFAVCCPQSNCDDFEARADAVNAAMLHVQVRRLLIRTPHYV